MNDQFKSKNPWDTRKRDKYCADCKFMGESRAYSGLKVCRRHPPIRDHWPVITLQDWCGEFQQSDQAKKEELEAQLSDTP